MGLTGLQLKKDRTQNFYDRIADVHNLALRINGYRASVARYLRSLDLKIDDSSLVLDAGCGTGLVTLGFQDAGFRPRRLIAFDLSSKSLEIAGEQLQKARSAGREWTDPVQGNVLRLPFADETFDLVLACGVLEYVSLEDGLRELARVIKSNGRLVFIPVKPSFVGSVLELIYKFKIHPLENVRRVSQRYFTIVGNHKFPFPEPIAWSKTIFLLEKK